MKCAHLHNIVQLSLVELCKLKKDESCTDCETNGPNLWICLQKNCLHIGCSEQYKDHSTIHFQSNRAHCIHMNLSSQRVWCYLCESELFLTKPQPHPHLQQQQQQQQQQQHHHHYHHHRRTSVVSNDSSETSRYSSVNNDKLIVHEDKLVSGATPTGSGTASAGYGGGTTTGDSCDSSGEEDDFERHGKWNGLVGLQNLANTCYMNAALQALSNSPPLTGYFLDCGAILETDLLGGTNPSVAKPGLAKHYHKLIREMWCKNRRYVVPSGILCGIRIVHPMFRGYQQHDTQEFLRCFMDQLHEELKEVTAPPPPDVVLARGAADDFDDHSDGQPSPCSSPTPSQSEGEYETCDSGVSERSSLSDDQLSPTKLSGSKRFRKLSSRSPSPPGSGLGGEVNQRMVQPAVRTVPRSSSVRQQSPVGSNRSNASTVSTASVNIGGASGSPGSGGGGGGGGGSGDPSDGGSTKEKLPQRSIISDIFDGKLLSSVQCLTCDRVSTREETFQDLSLPIPGKDHLAVLHQTHPGMGSSGGGPGSGVSSVSSGGSGASGSVLGAGSSSGSGGSTGGGITCSDAVYPVNGDSWLWWFWNSPFWSWVRSWFWGPAVTLHDCMAAFFSADELKGDNMYSCERCNKLRNGVKYSRVLALPEMLCVHLKRFRHDLSYSSKISSPVLFPLYGLDMRPYLHKDCRSEVTMYDLCAVICHHGTVGGGHYTSFAKHEPTGKWFEFDDQLVTQVTPEHVQSCEAYVFFYRKNNAKMATVRAQASNLLTMQEHASDIRFYVSRNWLHRFNTFAEPGPIDNWTLLCPHGAFPPNKASHFSKLVVPFPQALWDFLYKKFGGGPVCNHIFPCHICKKAAETLSRRQHYELETFTAYNDDFMVAMMVEVSDKPTTIYAISMAWFRQWQLFARGLTNEDPGPIQNKSIAIQGDTSVPLRSVRPFSDYAQINANLWHFFHGIYGGGPEIVLQGNPVPPPVLHQVPAAQQEEQAKPQQQQLPKVPESMDVSEEGYSAPEAVVVRSTTVTKQTDQDSAIEVTISEPLPSPPPQQQQQQHSDTSTSNVASASGATRPQKSVSFEDTDAYHDEDSSGDELGEENGHSSMKQQSFAPTSKRKTHTKTTGSSRRHEPGGKTSGPSDATMPTGFKRKQQHPVSGKHQSEAIPVMNGDGTGAGNTATAAVSAAVRGVEHLEIGSKKDRRHRGSLMKANGFFGPEGKYQSSSNDYANGGKDATAVGPDTNSTLPRTESLSFHSISTVGMNGGGRSISSSVSVPTFAGQTTTSKMTVDELASLLSLAQPTVDPTPTNSSSANSHDQDAELREDDNDSKTGSSSLPSTTSSAKTSSRKGHHRPTGADTLSAGSVTEKIAGGMSLGRRKLKMKYMKKLAGRKSGSSGARGRNGTLIDGGDGADDDGGATVIPLALNGVSEHVGGEDGEGVK
ncbi:ubiquitin carboxyl-terminal hydrolase 20 isoform X2 [Anopheles stephensi]|uniref:ubiquitin carboxyl-terminal hydrolase 20 isoform X2 n=1 Tax=Anopheles stephensi TaxID=30069 RepID=UPI001658BCD8|nr:ubiquitin carboxyl-terminal hydrolase 20 isoform X2 [Anopheles stephensi]